LFLLLLIHHSLKLTIPTITATVFSAVFTNSAIVFF
jgi:hypothetical protein